MRAAIVLASLLFAFSALAQVDPPHPNTNDFVRYAVLAHSSCGYYENVEIDGFDITIELFYVGGACTSAAREYWFDLGYLPPGTYNVTVYYDRPTSPPRTSTFEVVSASVPTLSTWVTAVLLGVIAVLGAVATRVSA